MKLGKKSARPNSIKLKLVQIMDATHLPVPPPAFGHANLVHGRWSVLGNDAYGDCVWAGAAHEQMLFSLAGKHGAVKFDDKSVLSDYAAVTGFDASNPATDQGTDMQEAASYRRKTGVIDYHGIRHKIDAYAEITRGDLSQVALATWLFGACGIGVEFPNSAMDQFDAGKAFSVVPGAKIEGGHYMPCIGRHKDGNYVLVTWGKTVLATPEWMRKYMDESIAYISRDIIRDKTQMSEEGFDLAALDNFLSSLSK
jgi:hypothetical protein